MSTDSLSCSTLRICGADWKLRKICIISKQKADLPPLRVKINFAFAILSKTEQGSTLLEENNWGLIIHKLIKY